MTKHTEAPWIYKHGGIWGPDGFLIAAITREDNQENHPPEELEANGVVLAAAPVMEEILEAVAAWLERRHEELQCRELYEAVESIILAVRVKGGIRRSVVQELLREALEVINQLLLTSELNMDDMEPESTTIIRNAASFQNRAARYGYTHQQTEP